MFMNYIIEFSESEDYNAIYICVDRFTKMIHFCLITINVIVEETIKLYLHHVFKHHDLSHDVIFDRNTQFTFKFKFKFLELCDIKNNKFITFHFQSNDQTKRVNQVLKQYLRVFCDYQQDD